MGTMRGLGDTAPAGVRQGKESSHREQGHTEEMGWGKREGQGQTGDQVEGWGRCGDLGGWGRTERWRSKWAQLGGKHDAEVTALEQGPWRRRPPPF